MLFELHSGYLNKDYNNEQSGCSAVRSALHWGCSGRRFKSGHPDQN